MSWKEMIPGCFGKRDLVYANSSFDKKRAIEMVAAANKENVTKTEFITSMRDYMLKRGTELGINNLSDHIEKQMKYILRRNFDKGTSKILDRE